MKIAVFSTKPYDQEFFERYNADEQIHLSYFETPLNSRTANLTQGFKAVCVFVNDKVDERTLEILAEIGVRLIALRCAGFNNIDLEAAKRCNIKIVRVPAYSPEAVAEHALALILTLNRKTHKAYNRVREGNFSLNKLLGFNLNKKTVGVIGTGRIGTAFCRILWGFGCKIIATDKLPNKEMEELGVEYRKLEEVFKQSDILSLHCPLLPDTQHIINGHSLSLMKDGVMIINTSRGGLINTRDIIRGLKSRKIGYLGIDVYEQEEHLFFQDLSESIIEDELILRLIGFPNVLITSHQAYFTREAMSQITLSTLKNIRDFMEGKKLENEVV